MGLKFLSLASMAEIASSVCSILFAAVLTISPLLVGAFLYKKQDYLFTKWYRKRVKTIFMHLKVYKVSALMFNVIFISRRLLICLLIVIMSWFPAI
jgi:hypothetical protein